MDACGRAATGNARRLSSKAISRRMGHAWDPRGCVVELSPAGNPVVGELVLAVQRIRTALRMCTPVLGIIAVRGPATPPHFTSRESVP